MLLLALISLLVVIVLFLTPTARLGVVLLAPISPTTTSRLVGEALVLIVLLLLATGVVVMVSLLGQSRPECRDQGGLPVRLGLMRLDNLIAMAFVFYDGIAVVLCPRFPLTDHLVGCELVVVF